MTPMTDARDGDEFLVSQYLDGTLDDAECRKFEQRLETDSELSALLRAYRAVDEAIGSWARRAPEIDWSRFELDVRKGREKIDSPGRPVPVVYKLFVPLAVAASVMFAFVLLRSTVVTNVSEATVVVVGAPKGVEHETAVFEVTYSYRDAEVNEFDDPLPARVVLAKAAVGGHVRWPRVDELFLVN